MYSLDSEVHRTSPDKVCVGLPLDLFEDCRLRRRLGMCHATKTLMRCHRRAPLRRSVFPRFLVVAKMARAIRTEIFFFPLYIANLHTVLPAFG